MRTRANLRCSKVDPLSLDIHQKHSLFVQNNETRLREHHLSRGAIYVELPDERV